MHLPAQICMYWAAVRSSLQGPVTLFWPCKIGFCRCKTIFSCFCGFKSNVCVCFCVCFFLLNSVYVVKCRCTTNHSKLPTNSSHTALPVSRGLGKMKFKEAGSQNWITKCKAVLIKRSNPLDRGWKETENSVWVLRRRGLRSVLLSVGLYN